jgi:hypothetical protein
VLGRLVAIEVAAPPLRRQLTAIWRPDLDPLPPEAARLLAVAKGAPLSVAKRARWTQAHDSRYSGKESPSETRSSGATGGN